MSPKVKNQRLLDIDPELLKYDSERSMSFMSENTTVRDESLKKGKGTKLKKMFKKLIYKE